MIDIFMIVIYVIISIFIAINLLVPFTERAISDTINKKLANKIYKRMEIISFLIISISIICFFYSIPMGTILFILGMHISYRAEVYKDRSENNYIYNCNIDYKLKKKAKSKLKKLLRKSEKKLENKLIKNEY